MQDFLKSLFDSVTDPFTHDVGKYTTGTVTKSSDTSAYNNYFVPYVPYPWEVPYDDTNIWKNTGTTLNITVGQVDKKPPEIKDVIFNPPATIILWEDGTKTVVKCQNGDTYSKETGLALAICKKVYGNTGAFNDVFNRWLK